MSRQANFFDRNYQKNDKDTYEYSDETYYYTSASKININRIYALALLVSITFLAFGIAFVNYAENISHKDTVEQIQKAVKQTKFSIDEHIKEEFDTLMAAAMPAKIEPLQYSDEQLNNIIKALDAHSSFVYIGFANKDGQAFWMDQKGIRYEDNLSS